MTQDTDQIVEIQIDCVDPEALLEKKSGVFIRLDSVGMSCLVTLLGPRKSVMEFIENDWGPDVLQMLVDERAFDKQA